MTDIDVLVAGAGGAGLAAALAAAQGGASVAVLEWREQFRQANNTAMSTSMVPAGGSRWQAEAGIEDSPDRFLADILKKTGGTAEPGVARALVDVAPELVAWLHDRCEVPLDLVTDFVYPGHSTPRCHSVPDRSGRSLLAALLAAVPEGADLLAGTRLTGLTRGDDGWACETTDPVGASEQLTAGSVVLATGGFGADKELVARYLPEIVEGVYFGGDGCVGDGLRFGTALGADTSCLDAYQGHGSLAASQGTLTTWATVMHGAVLVNRDGRRFGDETVGYSEYATKVLDQPGAEAFVVLDERVDGLCRDFRDYLDLREQGGVRWAADVAKLAGLIGAPVDTLQETLDQAAAAAAGKASDPFGRTDFAAPLVAPLGVVRVTGALFHTQGGLLVDGRARVLAGGSPLDGLYAAGGSAVGISGHGAGGYLAGNGLLAALGLGYLAGTDAVARLAVRS
jgi:fumarate reductase flavoprotein subunit